MYTTQHLPPHRNQELQNNTDFSYFHENEIFLFSFNFHTNNYTKTADATDNHIEARNTDTR